MQKPPTIAILYDDSAYVETLQRPAQAPADGPIGLMGRQVAGKEFLDAYLRHGSFEELVAVVYYQASVDSLTAFCQAHPAWNKRRLKVIDGQHFHARFAANPPAPIFYTPCPPDPGFAWARQFVGPGNFALSGVTHTLASPGALQVLCELITAPYESFDALICTSRAVAHMVRTVADDYAEHLRERFGGNPMLRPRLATIPLGVGPDKFRPAMPEERDSQRRALGIGADEIVVLFVGRLSFHAKAHPAAMFLAAAQAARTTGRKVRLLLAGWGDPGTLNGFADAARALCPNIGVHFVDGTRPDLRFAVWRAADLFTSLSDNVQETFGLVVIEAMACGLPVVASDWDGYRDLVVDGETGVLVPTFMVAGAAADAVSRLLTFAELSYDHFLGETNQTVTVDIESAAQAYARLIEDADLRRRMGDAGRRRVLDHFAWRHVIAAYEALWAEQEAERQAHVAPARPSTRRGKCPPIERAFASYPTALLDAADVLAAGPDAAGRLGTFLALPLTCYAGATRVQDQAVLQQVLAAAGAGRPLGDLDDVLRRAGASPGQARATLAWLLKYNLLRPCPRVSSP
jgi:glycosyltransferase involved in cell wall biosynthesis